VVDLREDRLAGEELAEMEEEEVWGKDWDVRWQAKEWGLKEDRVGEVSHRGRSHGRLYVAGFRSWFAYEFGMVRSVSSRLELEV